MHIDLGRESHASHKSKARGHRVLSRDRGTQSCYHLSHVDRFDLCVQGNRGDHVAPEFVYRPSLRVRSHVIWHRVKRQ